ncbi:HPP family protein [Vampirovibrio sp.]|uniref:CBS domain-containing protein n=1 Tax=Vampirovibrio sp. TaxID=2717857 RepID=UPI003593E267
MNIKDIMSTPVLTIDQNRPATEANELMWRHQIHHLVVTHLDQIVGILSDTDLGGNQAEEIPDRLLVKDAMTAPVTTVQANTLLEKAVNLMSGNHFHSLPVVDEHHQLIGIVTQTDLERLSKRGRAQGPFQGQQKGQQRTLGSTTLARREGRGAKSKHSAGGDQPLSL